MVSFQDKQRARRDALNVAAAFVSSLNPHPPKNAVWCVAKKLRYGSPVPSGHFQYIEQLFDDHM
jgi:hypothetical protein